MDSVSRYWNDNWNRNGIALLDAAKSAAAAARIPVVFPQLRIEWSAGASEPPTMAAARDKLLASPSPERMWITVSDDPNMVSRKVFLRLKANGDLVHLEAEGTAMSETVAAFDAAVAVLEA